MKKIAKYKIIEEIGRGGMGVVYKAHDPQIDRFVAIKIILEKALENREIKARFMREARTAGKLSHENLTVIYDLGEEDGKTFIVMEFLEGEDLRTIIKNKEQLPLQQKLEYAKQICKGLHFAHDCNVIHRDIKPENIKILPNGKVKIIDFGIAKPDTSHLSKEEQEAGTVVTQLGMRIGTPWYMSPEQVKGEPVDRRSDIFSFGVLLYEFLTYQKPFEGDDTTVMYRILHEEPDKINLEESGLVDEIQEILSKCLAKQPEERYHDCGMLFVDLDNVFEKAKQEKRIAKLLSEGNALAQGGRFSEAIVKFNEILQIQPEHKEASRNLKRLIEQEKETKTFQILSGHIIGEVISHYKITERLGRGGMGVVFKAEDLTLKRIVALKFLQPELTRNEEAKKRFFQEARAASALDHPNICTIHEIDETDDGLIFICMAYYEGQTLREKIDKGRVDLSDGLNIAIKIATGLAKAHSHGILHRDIKPANIIITTDYQVKIVDFGLAKLSDEATRLTKSGTTLGTPYYMSPEQVKGGSLDHRSDIWSFGVVLYQLLTGKLPFEGGYGAEVLYEIVNKKLTSPSKINPEIPVELEHIIKKMLNKSFEARFDSIDDIITNLYSVQKQLEEHKESDAKRTAQLTDLIQSGKACLSNGKYEEALAYFNSALDIAPKDRQLLALKKDCEAGLRDLQRATKLFDSGKQYMAKGKYRKAIDMFSKAAALNPNDAELPAYTEKAKSQLEQAGILAEANQKLRQKNYRAAFDLYSQVLQIDPDNKEAAAGLKKSQKTVALEVTKSAVIDPPSKSGAASHRGVFVFAMLLVVVAVVGGVYYFNRSGKQEGLSRSVNSAVDSARKEGKAEAEEQLMASTEPIPIKREITQSPSGPPVDSVQALQTPEDSLKKKDVGVFERQPPRTGKLDLTSTPTGVEVYLNDDPIGRTPFKASELEVGDYELLLRKIGFADLRKRITIKSDEILVLNETLTALTGSLDIVSNPTGATVLIDNSKIGTTPITIDNIDLGRHRVVLRKEGFEQHETSVDVGRGEITRVNSELKALTGQLRILVRPYGTIFVNGALKSENTFTPYAEELPVGSHTIKIVHPNLGTWEKEVRIQSNQLTEIPVNFNQEAAVPVLSHDSEGKSVWGKIFVDGENTGHVTPKEIKLRVGQHRIAVQRAGFKLEGGEQVINVEENMQPLKFILKKIKN